MARPEDRIDPQRLCDAAEAVLAALVEVADHFEGAWPWPPDLMGTPMQPACLAEYSREEVDEATMFLVRLGVLERKPTKKSA